MIPECISFQAIPHTTRLFSDFLSYSSDIRRFYPHPPEVAALAMLSKSVAPDPERQARVADVLATQNRGWGASEQTLQNIQRLRDGALAVVTGQQVGLFGGPLLAFLKVATALSGVRQLRQMGLDVVPVFWLASEDHDLDEVNQILLPTGDVQISEFRAPTTGVSGSPVASIRFAEGTADLVAQAAELLGDSLAADYLRESYREGETFSNAYARLYTRMFAEHGLILLDPSDPGLHRIAAPLFVEAVKSSDELDRALLQRNHELAQAHYHEQVKITEESTPLFALVEGKRVPIHRKNGGFVIGRDRLSIDELTARIQAHPEQFNANVLLRPVLQDYWLPTLGYIGGPAEVAYFAQVGVVYEKLLGRVTPILPRLSATLIEPRIERLLEKYELDLTEVFHGECQLRDCLAARTLPADLKDSFTEGKQAIMQAMRRINASLEKLDSTLVEAAGGAGSKMLYQLDRLQARAAQAELRRDEVLTRHAALLENSLYPKKTLQEREIAALYFYAKYGTELIERLIEAAGNPCPEHKLIKIGPTG